MSADTLLLTYREGLRIPLRDGSILTSDAGWSCTLRSVQTLVANALVRADAPQFTTARLTLLFDDSTGALGLGALLHSAPGKPRRWRGPGESSHLMQRAALRTANELPFGIVTQADATIVEREIFSTSSTRPTLVLVPLRLNESARLSDSSAAALCAACALPFFIGAIAGVRGHSLTLTGVDDKRFHALDPHRVQYADTVSLVALESDWKTVVASDLESSVSLGFLVRPCDYSSFRAQMLRALPVSFTTTRTNPSSVAADLLADSPVSGGEWVDAAADGDDLLVAPLSPPSSPIAVNYLTDLARNTAASAARVWAQLVSTWRTAVRATARTASQRMHRD